MTFTLLPIPVLSSVFKSAVTGVTDAMLSAFTAVEPVSAESVLPVVLSETDEDVCLFCIALCQCIIVFDLCQNIASVFQTSGIGIDTLHVL